jgi:hypothetical protein
MITVLLIIGARNPRNHIRAIGIILNTRWTIKADPYSLGASALEF